MVQEARRSGQCSCGAVRYETAGEPVRVSICHCKQCQLRTGSAFGINCYFPEEKVKVLQGSMNVFDRGSDAGRLLRFQFCEQCGTTVLWHAEVFPQAIGVAGGTFDDTEWISPKRHVWASSAQGWMDFPDGVEVLQQSNLELD